MPATHNDVAAVVLACHDHGESDKIVTFFCRDIGRITGIAKGANKSKKRFVNKLELFSSLLISYKENNRNSLAFISEAELVASFIQLRQDFKLYTTATAVREIILAATREREGDDGLLDLLLWTFESLDQQRPHLSILVMFMIKLFGHIGYRPDFGRCASCLAPISETDQYGFSPVTGGLHCRGCAATTTQTILPLSLGTIKFLATTQDKPLQRLHQMRLSGDSLEQALVLVHRYSRHIFQKDLNSWKLLRR